MKDNQQPKQNDNALLKPRITSSEYFNLPEDQKRFYMRFCGHKEVYYTLNPSIKP
jgi:hypothetical protein